jgi:hypothetical protein
MAIMTIETGAEARVWPAEATCLCGQPLECSHTAHCPRCGITLRG